MSEKIPIGGDYPLVAMLGLGTNPYSFLAMSRYHLAIHSREKSFLGQDKLIKKPILDCKHHDPLVMMCPLEKNSILSRDISYRDCLVVAVCTRS